MTTAKQDLFDMQAQKDTRGLKIDRVGIKDVRYPFTIRCKDPKKEHQHVVASLSMQVDLPADQKGTHMSRFMEALNQYRHGFSAEALVGLCNNLKARLQSSRSFVEVEFNYFIERKSPMTGKIGLVEHTVKMAAQSSDKDKGLILEVTSPITTLCPCSKEISAFGAHNQRGKVSIAVRPASLVWIEDLVAIIEGVGSSNIYPILKRTDEKFVTEQAYENPKFVEDVVRDAAERVRSIVGIEWFTVRCINYESIHAHNAYAEIEVNNG